jgi:hypothetical protein
LDEQGQALIKATGKVWKSGAQGAATAIVAAFDPKLNGTFILQGVEVMLMQMDDRCAGWLLS